jgi:hypothetical protein
LLPHHLGSALDARHSAVGCAIKAKLEAILHEAATDADSSADVISHELLDYLHRNFVLTARPRAALSTAN